MTGSGLLRDMTRAPWALRGQALVTLRAGEALEAIHSHRDVVEGFALPSTTMDGGPLDRTLRRFTPAMRVTRQFQAARGVGHPGQRHRGWDELEDELGISRTFRVDVARDTPMAPLLDALRSLAAVQSASPHYLARAPFGAEDTIPLHGEATWAAHDRVGVGRAIEVEPGDASVLIAVVDSGVQLDHPELSGRLRPGADLVDLQIDQVDETLVLFGDVADRDRMPQDDMGHGTACTGIIAARGLRVPPGVGGKCRVLPIRALAGARVLGCEKPTAIGGSADIDAAVKTAVDLGARVLNLSFGTPESVIDEAAPIPHETIVRYALRHGCIVVAASGNRPGFHRYFPAALPGVICVGSVDALGRPSHFMSRGDHVAICAPGEDVPCPGIDGYQSVTGTSFACPFVAGVCALLLSRAARYSTPLDSASALAYLKLSAAPFTAANDTRGCGAGILDAPSALAAVDATLAWPAPPETDRIRLYQEAP